MYVRALGSAALGWWEEDAESSIFLEVKVGKLEGGKSWMALTCGSFSVLDG